MKTARWKVEKLAHTQRSRAVGVWYAVKLELENKCAPHYYVLWSTYIPICSVGWMDGWICRHEREREREKETKKNVKTIQLIQMGKCGSKYPQEHNIVDVVVQYPRCSKAIRNSLLADS